MFVTKDEIRRMVKQVITDDVNNDIVFIVANKGFGKYKLLKEINGYEYQKHVIITNGEQFHSASLVKNCLMHGIYEYLRRNNILDQRKSLRLLIKKEEKNSLFRAALLLISILSSLLMRLKIYLRSFQ